MWKAPLRKFNPIRQSSKFFFSSSSPSEHFQEPVPVLYSFLRPTLFSPPTPSPQTTFTTPTPSTIPRQTLDPAVAAAHQSSLVASINASNTDEVWKSFKTLTSFSHFPPQDLTFSLISYLCSRDDIHNLKRAFTSAVFLLDKNPNSISFQSLQTLFSAFHSAGTHAPAFALVKSMFKNRVFPPFSVWGGALVVLTKARPTTTAQAFLEVFEENCRIAAEEKVEAMVPNLGDFNAAMDVCCRNLGSVSVAMRIVATMSVLGVTPDVETFGAMGYLFAWKGMEARIVELEELIPSLGFTDQTVVILENLIRGYIKSGDPKAVSAIVMRSLQKEGCRNSSWKGFSSEAYGELVNCFLKSNGGGGGIKALTNLIIESQEFDELLEEEEKVTERSVGFGIVNACVHLDMLDKAHSILDEMTARGAPVGIGVYSSILKAYCKERRMAEAAQLVTQVNAAGLQLDPDSYAALIDASMSAQDFHSAFSIFRGMRDSEAAIVGGGGGESGTVKFDLKMNYLTIMTGLMENHRPELMAGFLDTVFEDPRLEVATHDWNSIIHAFCKVGRLEDARRTYRRMIFLQFEPNEQTYLSLINGYVNSEKYFSVLMLWMDVKKKKNEIGGFQLNNALVDVLLSALVKGGFFDAAMEVVERSQELKIFVDKWKYKQAFMETHKKLKATKLRRKNTKKIGALVAFKNWVGLSV